MATRPTHPEILPGELFQGNEPDGASCMITHWNSRRVGKIAYNLDGQVIVGFHPVFVSWDEVVSRGLDPATFGPHSPSRKAS